jgi:hypothetical protein
MVEAWGEIRERICGVEMVLPYVVGVVEQEPGARRPGQHDQPAAVGQEGPQPHLML